MIWTNILKKACNLCFLGAAAGFLLFNANIAQAAGCKGIIYIGDSRTVGMYIAQYGANDIYKSQLRNTKVQAQTVTIEKDGNYWYAQSGAMLDWLTSGIGTINSKLDSHDKIVIALGANNTGCTADDAKRAAKNYVRDINKYAAEWKAKGKKVYWSLVTKVDESKQDKRDAKGNLTNGNYCVITNAAVNAFNNAVKAGLSSDVSIINATSQATSTASDGIHYDNSVNKNIYNSIYSQACAGGDGQLGGGSSSGTSAENDCDLLSTDLKTCQTACAKYYPMPTNAYTECSAKCSTNSDFQYKNCITKQNAAASTVQSPLNNDVALSGKGNCKASESSQSLGRDSGGNVSTCSTVQKMKNNGSRSALANYGNECSTTASSCNSAAVKTTAQYRAQGNDSCFQGMPIKNTTGSSISSVVGMRPVEIGARSSSCVLDGDTGVKMRQHQGMDVGTACGTPLEAPADGFVEQVKNYTDSGGSGRWIKIKHTMNPNSLDAQTGCNYYYTVFYHMDKISKTGAVKKGDTVGTVGNGGGVFSCHMHMEVHKCNPHGELLNPLCSNNENLCNDKAGVSAVPINPIGSIGSGNGVRTNPYLGSKEDCDLFDLEECQKEPKDAKCPTKTKTKEQCEERNAAIESGGTYCPPSEDGKKDDSKASSGNNQTCTLNKDSYGATISPELQQWVNQAAQTAGVSPIFYAALLHVESGFGRNTKRNSATAEGWSQIIDSTWNQYTSQKICSGSRQNAKDSILCGGHVLKDAIAAAKADKNAPIDDFLERAIAGYNAGPYCDKKGRGVQCRTKKYGADWKQHLPSETKDYLTKMSNYMSSLAKNNGCSLGAENGWGVYTGGYLNGNCENFNYTDGYGGSGSLYGQIYGQSMADFESAYECNIAEHSNSVKGCIFCDMFKTIFNASSKVARQCHKTFSDSLVTLVAIGLAISLAYMIIPYLSNMTVQDPHRFINDIIQRVFIVVVVILLLKMDVTQFFDMFITPIFTTGMKLSELAISTEFAQKVSEYSFSDIDGSGLPQEMAVGMLRAIYAVQVRLEQMWALGANSICIAFFVKSYHHYPIFPHFGYLLTGLFMMLSAVIFMLIYPFLLIDAVLQFAIASSLLPLAIAATAFKPTRQYLNLMKILSIFINAMFIFIFLTIVMFVLLSGIDEAVRPHIEKAYSDSSANNLFDIREIGWYTQTFIKIIFFVFLGKAVLDDIPNFAEQFGEAFSYGSSFGKPDMGIGRKVGGTAVGAATNVAKTVGGTAWKATKGVGRGAKSFVGAAAKEGRRTYLINKTRRKASALAVGAAAGTATAAGAAWVSGRTWYGRKVQRRVVTDEKGNTVLESRQRSLFNRHNVTTTVSSDDINFKTKRYSDGTRKETYDISSELENSLINSDGTRNKEAYDRIMNMPGLNKDQKNKILLNSLLNQRMSHLSGANLEGKFKSEQIINSKDKDGNDVFTVRRTDKDGNVYVYKMTKGKERDLVEFEKIEKKTKKATKHSSDGIIQKKEKIQYDINEDGTINTEPQVQINGAEVNQTAVSSDGRLRDKDGHVLGQVLANGNIVDANNQVIGTAVVPDLVFDSTGNALGKMTFDGKIVDDSGNVKGIIDRDGNIVAKDGRTVLGKVSSEQQAKFAEELDKNITSSKVEFSNSKAYKGVKIFDSDGRRAYGMENEEIMFSQEDLQLYQRQMNLYGDVLKHHAFGK